EEWKKQLLRTLTERAFRSIPGASAARITFAKGIINELEAGEYRKVGMFLIGREDGVLILDRTPKAEEMGKEALALIPYSRGFLGWTKKSPPNYVERSHALL